MTTITKPSFVSRYVCKIKFFVVLFVCILVFASGVYFFNNSHNKMNPATEATEQETVSPKPLNKWETNEEIQIFREYLRIPSVHPDIDYEPCVEFLKRQAKSLDLPVQVHYPVNDKNPVVVITWEGSNPELPTIMLNSHMDVVQVYEEYWTYPPFAAEMDENGNIFARGAQDVKLLGTQYLGAIRALKRQGMNQLNRTVHVIFVPDEEEGGLQGMAGFVHNPEFEKLNVGFVLDEGGELSGMDGQMGISYAERIPWKIEFIFHGQSGHGSSLFVNTAGEKLSFIVNKLMEMRKTEVLKLDVLKFPTGKVTSINLTLIKGGVQNNVIPAEMSATFDIRFSYDADLDAFEKQVGRWCDEAGGDITVNYTQKEPKAAPTAVDGSNPFWGAIKSSFEELNVTVYPMICAGATDARYLRRLNIPALGFIPLINTTLLIHSHNEYLNADTYLFGIELFKKIIPNLANI